MIDRRRLLAAAGFALLPRPAAAQAPILTISGPGATGPIALDLARLDAMRQTSFRTTTPWHPAETTFSGVAFADLLAALGLEARAVRLVALNDYVVEAQVEQLVAGDGLLATRENGTVMTVENKGPVFVVFPFDQRPELQHQSYYSRSVWQLAEIDLSA